MLLGEGAVGGGGGEVVPQYNIDSDTNVSLSQQLTGDGTQIKGSGQSAIKGGGQAEKLDPALQDQVDQVVNKLAAEREIYFEKLRATDPSHPELSKPVNETEIFKVQQAFVSGYFAGASIAFAIAATIAAQEEAKNKKQSTGVSAEIFSEHTLESREGVKLAAEQKIEGAQEMLDQATAAMVVGIMMGAAQVGMAAMQFKTYKEGVAGQKGAMDTPEMKTAKYESEMAKANYGNADAARQKAIADAPTQQDGKKILDNLPKDTPTEQQVADLKKTADAKAAKYEKMKEQAVSEGHIAWQQASTKSGIYGALSQAMGQMGSAVTQQMNAQGQFANQYGQAQSEMLSDGAKAHEKTADSIEQGQKDFDETAKSIIEGLMQALSKYTEAVTQLMSKG